MKQSAVHLLHIILVVHHENHQEEQHVDQAVLDKVGKTRYGKLSAILYTGLQSRDYSAIILY